MKTKRYEVIVEAPKGHAVNYYTETKETKREAESRRDALKRNGVRAKIRKQQ